MQRSHPSGPNKAPLYPAQTKLRRVGADLRLRPGGWCPFVQDVCVRSMLESVWTSTSRVLTSPILRLGGTFQLPLGLQRRESRARDINSLDPASGRSPLHVAALNGSTKCVNILLKSGASVHLRDSLGHTALYYARSPCPFSILSFT